MTVEKRVRGGIRTRNTSGFEPDDFTSLPIRTCNYMWGGGDSNPYAVSGTATSRRRVCRSATTPKSARDGSRTRTPSPVHAPETCASANSATRANMKHAERPEYDSDSGYPNVLISGQSLLPAGCPLRKRTGGEFRNPVTHRYEPCA